MDNQSNKKPIDEVLKSLKQLKTDITELQKDVSYIKTSLGSFHSTPSGGVVKKRLYADNVEKQMKEEKEEISTGWFF